MGNDRPVKRPTADHPITIEPADTRTVVTIAGQVIADTRKALILREAAYPPVYYIPRSDVDMPSLHRSEHSSYCPFKGEASYFSIPAGGDRAIDAVWSYEAPYEWVAATGDHLAFYPDRVDSIEQRD